MINDTTVGSFMNKTVFYSYAEPVAPLNRANFFKPELLNLGA